MHEKFEDRAEEVAMKLKTRGFDSGAGGVAMLMGERREE